MNQQLYRKLISGESQCRASKILRFCLLGAAKGYAAVIAVRNFLYSKGWLKTYYSTATVISVGNITTGGTGKTPLVIWLCKYLTDENISCAVLTRGYKSQKHKLSDEPAIVAKNCPAVKVIVNPNRVAGAEKAVKEFSSEVLIMDDGFQHRRLGRDLNIVTIDGTVPFGYGKMLPAGMLREPMRSLERADAVVITRTDQCTDTELNEIEEKLRCFNSDMIIARSVHKPISAKCIGSEEITLKQLEDKMIFAFCGIGNPESFFASIREIGSGLVGTKVFNDHYRYKPEEVTDICEQANYLDADVILTTQKDWTKTALLVSQAAKSGSCKETAPDENMPFAYLAIELEFTRGEEKLRSLIQDTLAGKINKK